MAKIPLFATVITFFLLHAVTIPPVSSFTRNCGCGNIRSVVQNTLNNSQQTLLLHYSRKLPTKHKERIIDTKIIMNSTTSPLSDLTKHLVFGSNDILFGSIERNQLLSSSSTSFGHILDAGTGSHSLRWIASLMHPEERKKQVMQGLMPEKEESLRIERYTAVTADEQMKRKVEEEAIRLGIQDMGDVVIGNWQVSIDNRLKEMKNGIDATIMNRDEEIVEKGELCKGMKFDTILADYLVGAMDGFSPYYQDLIFPQLSSHLKEGGRLYVVGLNPIPDEVKNDDANIFCKVTKLRDACILLAGHRCYREYPLEWIVRHLESAGLQVIHTSKFPILYSHATIVRQLDVARSKLSLFPSKGLADEMRKSIDALERESKMATDRSPNGRLKLGFDYVVTAEKPRS